MGALNASDQTHCPGQCVSLWDVPVPRALFCLNGSTGSQLGPKLVRSSPDHPGLLMLGPEVLSLPTPHAPSAIRSLCGGRVGETQGPRCQQRPR